MSSNERKTKIKDAISKVISADIGAFCNILEKKSEKIMILVENLGEKDKVAITVQGELSDDQIEKAQKIIEEAGGDPMQLQANLGLDQAVEVTDKIFSELLSSSEFSVDIELAIE